MAAGPRIAFILAALTPLVLLQGKPELTPTWFQDEVAGIPIVIWVAIGWFALMVVASWLPQRQDGPR